ncbi:M15 family metallopeptidase [Thalassotalea aquiviva]|uniref:M15 family metallopeptidase n=1 Tax=Thalassotalea aquiviva TaxID=3242415 RepID=UPI00352AD3AA
MNHSVPNHRCLTGESEQHIHFLNPTLGIHKDMINAWQALQQAAKSDGLDLQIVSGFRSFKKQQSIFEAKLSGRLPVFDLNQQAVDLKGLSFEDKVEQILLFSALPGASRHHWGTDIDVFSPSLITNEKLQLEGWEYLPGGHQWPLTKWLDRYMMDFGFFRPYAKYQGGVANEPWHLSYQPLANQFQTRHNSDCLKACLQASDLADRAKLIDLVDTLYPKFISNITEP